MLGLEAWLSTYSQLLGQTLFTLLVFHCLEKFNPVEANQPLKTLAFNVVFLSLNLGLVLWLLPQLQPCLILIRSALHGGFISLPAVATLSLWQAIAWSIGYAFIWDLLQYTSHRLQHSVPFLWEIHKFHHSESALSSVSAGRKHIFEYVIEDFTIVLPTILIFSDPSLPVFAQFVFFRLWGLFNHMNTRLKLGPLCFFICGPQFHRIHHSILPQHYDKNFATFFPFLDRIFGTHYSPAEHEYPPTGLSGEDDVQDLVLVNIRPVQNWLSSIYSACSRSNKHTITKLSH